MEQDIDDLEELRKELGLYANKNKIRQGIALEHLLKAYKELEEENIHWKGQYHLENRKYIDLHNKKIDIPIINATEEMLQQYIPKSKIKEKIEELNRKIKYEDNEKVIIWLHKQRNILQELLEKR